MQTRTGVEYSSLACLVRYGLFYRCEKLIINWNRCICTFGGRCVVGWCLDNPSGGSITGSCCSQSSYQYQCGAILSADVCVDAVHRLYIWYYPVVSRVHPASPYQHLIYYTTGMANLNMCLYLSARPVSLDSSYFLIYSTVISVCRYVHYGRACCLRPLRGSVHGLP